MSFCQRVKWRLNGIYCSKLSCVDYWKTSTQTWTCNSLSPRPFQHLPMVPSVPQNKEWLSASSVGTWLGLPPAAGPWRPQDTSRAAGADPAAETLIAMEIGWAVLLCSSPHPAWSFLPTHLGWAWVHIACLKQIYWLWCLVFVHKDKLSQKSRGFPSWNSTPLQGLALAVTLKWKKLSVVIK